MGFLFPKYSYPRKELNRQANNFDSIVKLLFFRNLLLGVITVMAKTSKSILPKLIKKAHAATKGVAAVLDSGGNLPKNIDGGIAQLVSAQFTKVAEGGQNAGKPQFVIKAKVISPKIHGSEIVEGRTFTKVEPLYDTPTRKQKTVADHWAFIINQLKLFGIDTDAYEPSEIENVVLELLTQEQPYFSFRTWAGSKATTGPYAGQEPQVQVTLQGLVPDELLAEILGDSDDDDEEDEDETEDADVEDSEEEDEEEVDDEAEEDVDDVEEDDVEEEDDDEDTEGAALGALADEGDEDAIAVLTAKARPEGLDPDEYETWTALEEAFSNGPDEEEEEEEEEESIVPDVGEIYNFKPPKKKKPVEGEITAVFTTKKTCNFKALASNVLYKGVSWDSLIEVE
jgi:hypothetical protein